MARPQSFTARDARVFAALLEEGRSAASIAQEYGCDPQTITNTVSRHGLAVPTSPPGRPIGSQNLQPSDRVRRQLKALASGLSVAQVASELGITRQAVYRTIRRWGGREDAQ